MPIRRALDYPYDIPETSYVISDGDVVGWNDKIDLSGRTPVLACGSNQSPTQLKRKFSTGVIPVMAGWLEGYDSVYSAHFTSYGSIAATYFEAKNVMSRQMITWLDEAQLQLMHESEALGVNYEYVEMAEISFSSDCDQKITNAFAYQSIRGPLQFNGQPVALQAIQAKQRSFQEMNEEVLQNKLLPLLSEGNDLQEFVLQTISDMVLRQKRTDCLVQMSR